MSTQRQRDVADLHDELRHNWLKWQELVDADCEFGARVAAILADKEDDKLGRINDLQYEFIEDCANYAIDCGRWFGIWGDFKRAAGLREPTPFDTESIGYC